jgi:hypothetical protein
MVGWWEGRMVQESGEVRDVRRSVVVSAHTARRKERQEILDGGHCCRAGYAMETCFGVQVSVVALVVSRCQRGR